MHYSILTGKTIDAGLEFLTEETRKKLEQKDGWLVTGQDDEGKIITVAAFVFNPNQPDTVELDFIYTRPEYREEGWAMGAIYYAQKKFRAQGVRRFICCPVGTEEELFEFSIFLAMAGFEPLVLDWHAYSYDLKNLDKIEDLKTYIEACKGKTKKLSIEEIKFYLHFKNNDVPSRVRDYMLRDCDLSKSLFVVEDKKIMGAVLVQDGDDSETNISNLYINPGWRNKHLILGMLARVVTNISEGKHILNLAIDSEQELNLYKYIFGEPMEDCLIQCYERAVDEFDMSSEELS